MKIGTLTGGGDTAALNATLKGLAFGCETYGYELIGFQEGWWGVLNKKYMPLYLNQIDENLGGSIIKCSRTNLLKIAGGVDQAMSNLKQLGIAGLVPIGGDDTLTVGSQISKCFPTVCITKTIDNDVGRNAPEGEIDYTKIVNYFCPGYPTAAWRVASYVRDLRTTVHAHNRIVVAEVMGRDFSWLALAAAYGNPDFVLTAETGFNYDDFVEKAGRRYMENGNLIIVVPEGLKDENGREITMEGFYVEDEFNRKKLGGVGEILAARLKKTLAPELKLMRSEYCHSERISYWQRAGSPTEVDRVIAKLLGRTAVAGIKNSLSNRICCVMLAGKILATALLPADDVLMYDKTGKIKGRALDIRFYDKETYFASTAGLKYLAEFVGQE